MGLDRRLAGRSGDLPVGCGFMGSIAADNLFLSNLDRKAASDQSRQKAHGMKITRRNLLGSVAAVALTAVVRPAQNAFAQYTKRDLTERPPLAERLFHSPAVEQAIIAVTSNGEAENFNA